jgi:hypothetical protein
MTRPHACFAGLRVDCAGFGCPLEMKEMAFKLSLPVKKFVQSFRSSSHL